MTALRVSCDFFHDFHANSLL